MVSLDENAHIDYGTAFLEASPDGVLLVDMGGRILAYNTQFVTMWSITTEVVASRSDEAALAFVIDKIEKPDEFLARVTYLYEHPTETSLDLVLLKDGRTFERYSAATHRPDGFPAGRMWFFRDISDRREMERRLALAERLASVGTLAAGVAHEVNNPLSYVRTNLDLILEDLDRPEQNADLRGLVIQARDGAERVRKIVRALKALARPDAAKEQAVLDVESVFDLSLDMAFNEIRHVANLRKEYRFAPKVRGNEVRLGQVFVNLLVNAAQAFQKQDLLSNEVRAAIYADESGHAVVEVSDNGVGIPAHLLGRIFDPFFTTKNLGVGTGLGLSISHHIVASMHGELTVHSEVGRGTTFRVRLPPCADETKPSILPPSRRASNSHHAKILIVDDDVLVAQALGRVLRAHIVTIVNSGQEALSLLAAGEWYDVIFCDLMMPGMSGMDLYEQVKLRWTASADRMVFITGGAASEASQSFLDKIPNEHIEKPFTLQTVRATVRRFAS